MTGGALIAVNVACTALLAVLALRIGVQAGRRAAARETARLRQCLGTFTHVLAPLPDAARTDGVYFLYGSDLAILALLVTHGGPEADGVADLETLFRDAPPNAR
ncbi:hypothetical protein ACQP10_38210 (plasmid) [Streptosporangium sandarakinum]|uniref:hypothetical protein n=1 Tax=Streptosporangium sandarakinum TaxID=1260955 RepID=UPI003D8FC994